MTERLASGAQLYRLNRERRLKLVDEGEPVTASEAHPLIAEIVRAYEVAAAREQHADR